MEARNDAELSDLCMLCPTAHCLLADVSSGWPVSFFRCIQSTPHIPVSQPGWLQTLLLLLLQHLRHARRHMDALESLAASSLAHGALAA